MDNATVTNTTPAVNKPGLKGGESLMGRNKLFSQILPLFKLKRKSTLIEIGKRLQKMGRSMKATDVVGVKMIKAAVKGINTTDKEIARLKKEQAKLEAKIKALQKKA